MEEWIGSVTVRIAMLNADTPVPKVLAARGSYGNIFHNLLNESAARMFPGTNSKSTVTVTSQDFDVVKGDYPSSVEAFDALLITGSASSSYDDNEWCRVLDRYVLDVYDNFPQIKIFGSCFGHQMVCQSLLRRHGAVVEKAPEGWELGVYEIALTEEFQKALGAPRFEVKGPLPDSRTRPLTPESERDEDGEIQQVRGSKHPSLRLQFIHADHVKLGPNGLPPTWLNMGGTKKCKVQGVCEPGRVLTYQGHFEFDRFINSETLRVFGAKWDPSVVQESLDAMDRDDDAEAACDMVLRFLLQGRSRAKEGPGGLLTPPLS